MSETISDIQRRIGEVFRINGTVPPEPKCGEGPGPYRYRALMFAQQLLQQQQQFLFFTFLRQQQEQMTELPPSIVEPTAI